MYCYLYLVGNFHSGINQLSVVSTIERHPVVPEVFEEVWQDLIHDVLGLHSVGGTALLHDLDTSGSGKILQYIKNLRYNL